MAQPLKDDRDLTRAQVQSLSSGEAVAGLFAYLGYPVEETRQPMTAEALALNAELSRATRRIERLSSLEFGALEIYLFELKSVTVTHTRNLARAFRDRAGDYLLALTDDYERLDFVLLEKVLPEQLGRGQRLKGITRRPRVLTVDRRNPDPVSLRVLRRFTFTEVDAAGQPDAYAQYDKLRSAYVVAEWSEPLFNNRALFSDYYLNQRLPGRPEWSDPARNQAFRDIRAAFAAARRRFAGQPAAAIQSDLIRPLLQTLGFTVETPTPTDDAAPDFHLTIPNPQSAIPNSPFVLAYPWNRTLDGKSDSDPDRSEENPGAQAVSLLEAGQADWAIVTNGKLWRLYSAQAHSRATNYYEIDLEETLASPAPADAFRYFYLFFRAEAFAPTPRRLAGEQRELSFLAWLLEESSAFAKELGERLKERVFEEIFPHLAEGFIHGLGGPAALLRQAEAEREATLETVFQATLTLLYRLLFLLYAESRDLLPVREVRGYYELSLQKLREEIAAAAKTLEDQAPARLQAAYSPTDTGLYDRLLTLFEIIDRGDPSRNVPVYNGGLFDTQPETPAQSTSIKSPPDPPKGGGESQIPPTGGPGGPAEGWGGGPDQRTAHFLLTVKIPDQYLALGLDRLARDIDPKRGDLVFIDYKSLGVRQLGSIYEGLLEFKVRVAPAEMAVVKGKKTEEVIPVSELPESSKSSRKLKTLPRGAVYLENDRRERKASGSYYTPDYIVKYIVQHTVGPVLDEKFEALRPRLETLATRFYTQLKNKQSAGVTPHKPALLTDMGGELLRDLFDLKVLDPAMGSGHFLVEAVDYITDRLVRFVEGFPFLSNFFEGMRQDILAEMERQAISIDPGRLTDVTLLKRHVLKRCIYGVDLNRMAVELAKVSLWLDCFTLGAPLSFLDHHLRWGNSLIGASAQTADREFSSDMPLFGGPFAGLLRAADLMRGVSLLTDVTLTEVEQSEQLFRQYDQEAKPYKQLLDLMVARHFGVERADEFLRLYGVDALKAGPDSVGQPYQTALLDTRRLFAEKRFFHWDLEFPEVFIDLERATWKSDGGFDAVVGNPPYIAPENQDKKNRDYYMKSGTFATASGRFDVYILFYENGLQHLRKDGIIGFITPYSVLVQNYGTELRELILKKHRIDRIVDLTSVKVFPDATVSPIVWIIQSGNDNEDKKVSQLIKPSVKQPHKFKVHGHLISNIFQKIPNSMIRLTLTAPTKNLLERLEKSTLNLGDIVYVITGCVVFGQSGSLWGDPRGKSALIHNQKINQHCRPYVEGKEVDRYGRLFSERFLSYEPTKMHRPKFPEVFEATKLFVRDIPGQQSLIATLDREGIYSDHTLNCLVPKYKLQSVNHRDLNFTNEEVTVSTHYSLEFLLALINSKFISFFYKNILSDGLHVPPEIIRNFPIRRIHFTTPPAERAETLAGLIERYDQGQDEVLLAQVAALLPQDEGGQFLAFAPEASGAEEQSDVIHDLLAHLAGQMIDLNQQKQAEQQRYFAALEAALQIRPDKKGRTGIDVLSGKTFIWGYLGDYQKEEPETEWAFIEDRLLKNNRHIGANLSDSRLIARLRTAYEQSLDTLRPLKARLARTDALIDQIVYRLYGLTAEEIEVVEGA